MSNGVTGYENPAAFRRERLASPGQFDADSFRTVVEGTHRIVVGCPKGEWDVRSGRCRVGMQAQAVLHPKGERNPCEVNPTLALVNPPRVWPEGEGPVEHLLNALMLLDDVLPYGDSSRASLRAATERIERALLLLDPKVRPGRGGNPPILALVNSNGLRVEQVGVGDRGRVMGTGVYAIAYKHADDGADYEHEFEKWDKVKLRVLNDRAVLLFSDTVDIIGMFTADDD